MGPAACADALGETVGAMARTLDDGLADGGATVLAGLPGFFVVACVVAGVGVELERCVARGVGVPLGWEVAPTARIALMRRMPLTVSAVLLMRATACAFV